MNNLEEVLQNIDGFCKVIIKKMPEEATELEKKIIVDPIRNLLSKKSTETELETDASIKQIMPLLQAEEPLIDIFEEEDHLRILVQCHCREQRVTFYVQENSVRICREEHNVDANGIVESVENCQKINLRTDHLQLENRLFVVARCNNNEVLEAMIPKKKLH